MPRNNTVVCDSWQTLARHQVLPPRGGRRVWLAFWLLLLAPLAAHGMDDAFRVGIAVGQHWDEDATLIRGSLLHPLPWSTDGFRSLAELSAGRHRVRGGGEVVWGTAARILLRVDLGTERLFLELGTGGTYYDSDSLDGKEWASRWQFRSSAGLGARIGGTGAVAIVYRASHSSNGGFRSPNPGLDEHSLALEVGFR